MIVAETNGGRLFCCDVLGRDVEVDAPYNMFARIETRFAV
jgi:hypothetical protein